MMFINVTFDTITDQQRYHSSRFSCSLNLVTSIKRKRFLEHGTPKNIKEPTFNEKLLTHGRRLNNNFFESYLPSNIFEKCAQTSLTGSFSTAWSCNK